MCAALSFYYSIIFHLVFSLARRVIAHSVACLEVENKGNLVLFSFSFFCYCFLSTANNWTLQKNHSAYVCSSLVNLYLLLVMICLCTCVFIVLKIRIPFRVLFCIETLLLFSIDC